MSLYFTTYTRTSNIRISGYDGLPVKTMDNLNLDNSRKNSNGHSATASPVDNDNSLWHDTDL